MRRTASILLVGSLIVAACGGSGEGGQTTTTYAQTSTTTTLGPSEGAWDLVYIQDSHGFYVADRYADLIEEARGVTVNVHDYAIGALTAVEVLENMRDEKPGGWADPVREAEIIVFFAGPIGSGFTADIGICFSEGTVEREPPQHYKFEDWQPYREILDEVYAEIWGLRDGEPVVLRAVDSLNPAIAWWEEAGVKTECSDALEGMNQTMREAAEANGATFVSMYDLFNGAEHDEDPREKGWIGSDGIHLNASGMDAVAEALRDSGFELNTAP